MDRQGLENFAAREYYKYLNKINYTLYFLCLLIDSLKSDNMDSIEGLKRELEKTKLACQLAYQIGKFKGDFLAKTAHELRSPLSSLMALHQLILSDLCTSYQEEREFIAQGYQAAQKLMKILDDMIAISKLECGSIKLQIEPISLSELLGELERTIFLQAANKNLRFTAMEPEWETYIMADFQHLLSGLVLLVDTAISRMEFGHIQVSTSLKSSSEKAEIVVDIHGIQGLWEEGEERSDRQPELSLESLKFLSHKLEMSPGMKFLLAQTLVSEMGGNLVSLDLSPEPEEEKIMRLQCSLPLAPPGVTVRRLEED